MAMAIISSRTRLGRRLFLGSPFVLAAGSALAQSAEIKFKHSSLIITTGAREIKFDVELALNDAERARGLMFRDKLGPYDGMLFDFYQDAPVSFWMKNTLIPLDMVFIAGDGTVKHVHANAVPLSTDPIPSEFPVRAVLEINGGSAKLLGIKPGDKVKHPIFGNTG
ncbi:MAG TPA: DUF192 domain-containing protein [Reyranella sp.]|jgi:uncharacterized protein|nr:DUF192 domain-containing protein [Reyranella sp.]